MTRFLARLATLDTIRIDQLRSRRSFARGLRARVWRELCFVRAVIQHRGLSFLLLFALLAGGGWMFQELEPGENHSLWRSMYFTWSLILGQPPESFPRSTPLQILFFLVPVLGLTVFLEAIVELSLMLRDRRHRERAWCKIMASSMKDHVILVGLGRLGIRTYHLLRKLGCEVVVVERNKDNQFLEDVRRDGAPLFIGDARREAWLEEANVKSARSIVLATTDDLANLEMALDARKLNPGIRVVMRMFDPNMAEKVREGFQIHTAMSAASLAAPAFATAALERSIVSSVVIDDELLITQRWSVQAGGPLERRTVSELIAKYGLGVIERRTSAGERRFFPPSDTLLSAGDEIVVQGPFELLERQPPGLTGTARAAPMTAS